MPLYVAATSALLCLSSSAVLAQSIPTDKPETQLKRHSAPAKKAKAKPAADAQQQKPVAEAEQAKALKPAAHIVQISGSFNDFLNSEPADPCVSGKLCAALVTGDNKVMANSGVKVYVLNPTEATVAYTGDETPVGLYLGLGTASKLFPFTPLKPGQALPTRRLVVSGDFCMPKGVAPQQSCASHLIANPGETASMSVVHGFIYGAGGADPTPVNVHQLSANTADIEFTAEPSFLPQWLALARSGQPTQTFPYTPAAPNVFTDAVYLAEDLGLLCDTTVKPGACPADTALKLQPVSGGGAATAELLSSSGNLLFTRVSSSGGLLPETIVVKGPDGKKSVLARRLTLPATDQSLLAISLTIMDQETAHKNFGAIIAQRYLAVELNVTNRSAKKLQFNKSAIWFDVDYVESDGRYRPSNSNRLSVATLDAVPFNVYESDFKPGDKVYRFGIEQNQPVSPDNYKTILNAYDFSTQKSERLFRYLELFGGVLSTIATGGSVAQLHDFAFRDAASIFSGTFLPGFRSVTIDTAAINRLRANLVDDTFQETVQIPPNGFASTIVLLPRDAILGMAGYKRAVLIDKVLNVHIDPDVLNGVKDPPVPLNHVDLAYTKDQVRQSLGDPPNVSTAADGSTVFSYGTGPYSAVNFDKTGRVTSWTPRPLADQLSAAPTLAAAKSLLQSAGVRYKELTLRNRHTLLVGIADVTKTPEYDADGKRVGDYTLLYDKITALAAGGKVKKAEFKAGLDKLALPGTMVPPPTPSGTSDCTYAMPDVQGGKIVVTFNATAVKDDPTIKSIAFTGEKP